jgi:hypothetical protein
LLKRRALRKEDRWVLPVIAEYGAALLSDKGNPSEAERRVIELASLARGATILLLAAAATRPGGLAGDVATISATTSDGKHVTARRADLLSAVERFMGIEARLLSTLGLEKRAAPAMNLSEYLASKRRADEPIPVEGRVIDATALPPGSPAGETQQPS